MGGSVASQQHGSGFESGVLSECSSLLHQSKHVGQANWLYAGYKYGCGWLHQRCEDLSRCTPPHRWDRLQPSCEENRLKCGLSKDLSINLSSCDQPAVDASWNYTE